MGSIALVIIKTIYSLLFISYRTITKSINQRIHHIEENTSTTNEQSAQIIIQEQKKNLRIFTILITMCTIYTITFLPNITYNIYFRFTETRGFIDFILNYLFNLLYYLSALVNLLITLFYKEEYRHTFSRVGDQS